MVPVCAGPCLRRNYLCDMRLRSAKERCVVDRQEFLFGAVQVVGLV